MITLIARLPIVEGKMDEALGAFKELMAKVAKEQGTLLYSLNREKANPDTLVVVEQYKDEDSLKFHSSTPYLKEFFTKSVSFTRGKPEVVLMEEISRT
jgi:quinol monooxygenase YgiN